MMLPICWILYYDVTDIFNNMMGTTPAAILYNAYVNGNLASEHAKSETKMQTKLDEIFGKISTNL